MSIFASPRFLRSVLIADAASTLGAGAMHLAFTPQLTQFMDLPAALLTGTGAFMLVYAAVVGFVASRDRLPLPVIRFLALGNFGWAAASVALLASGWIAPTGWGLAWVLMQAGLVAVLAELQWMGSRRLPVAGWA